MAPSKLASSVVCALCALLGSTRAARAEPTCTTIAQFNSMMDGVAGAVTTLELEFDVTGVNPADFAGSKGCLAEIDDERCSVGTGLAVADLKVYGPDDPPNTAHPPGTLKFEYGSECCATPPCTEGWADPNASATVFVDGSEVCIVRVWLNPTDYGYHIDCGGTLFDGIGDNKYDLRATQVAILERTDGGWAMPNAVSTYDQICYEPPVLDPTGPSVTLEVLEDVTVSTASPDSVYGEVGDLVVGTGDGEIYLKFDLGSVPGQVTRATIALHRSDVASADGSGGDAYLVPDSSWSETTLTWNDRPPHDATSLARVSPVADYDWYLWDVTAAVTTLGIHSFAIAPTAADTNGAHFFSKEGSATLRPALRIEYAVVDADDDGFPAGPDCDDGSAAVYPGADELCNGVDDDCDGTIDDDCGGTGGGGGDGAFGPGPGDGGAGAFGPAPGMPGNDLTDVSGGDCGCRLGGRAAPVGTPWLVAIAAALGRRRARRTTAAPVASRARGCAPIG